MSTATRVSLNFLGGLLAVLLFRACSPAEALTVRVAGDSQSVNRSSQGFWAWPEAIPAQVDNRSVLGVTSLWWMGQWMGRMVAPGDVDWRMLMIGTNDAVQGVDAMAYGDNVGLIVSFNAGELLLIAPPPHCDPALEERLATYRMELIWICANSAATCLDAGLGVEHLGPDCAHLSPWGHVVVAQAVATAVPEPGETQSLLVGIAILAALRRRATLRATEG